MTVVRLECGQCGQRLKTLETYVGKRGKCFRCENVFRITEELIQTASPKVSSDPEEVVKGKCEKCLEGVRLHLKKSRYGMWICRKCRPADTYERELLSAVRSARIGIPDTVDNNELTRLYKVVKARQKTGTNIPLHLSVDGVNKLVRKYQWKHESQTFFTKIAGVTFLNSDGSSRQEIIHKCRKGESLVFVREPNNEYDEYAVAVCRKIDMKQIGYLRKNVNGGGTNIGWAVTYHMDRGRSYKAMIKDITSCDGGHLGVNITVRFIPVEYRIL